MSNETVFERLTSLVKNLKPDIEDDLEFTALLSACALGFELVKDEFEYVKKQQYLDTMCDELIDKYCVLLDVDYQLSYDEKREMIKEKLSQNYEEYDIEDFESYIESLGEGCSVFTRKFVMKIKGIGSSDIYKFKDIMEMLENNMPPCVTISLSGTGITFDEWDAKGMTFETFESLGLIFSMLDTMNQ